MSELVDRRAVLRAAGRTAIGVLVGGVLRPAVASLARAGAGLLQRPSTAWRAAASEARDATFIAHESWLYYVHEAGGVDDPLDATRFLPEDHEGFGPYVPPAPYDLAKVVERQQWFRAVRGRDPRWSAVPCTPSEVRALPTGEVRTRLAALGIDASPDAFQTQVCTTVSPWSIFSRWTKHRELPAPEEDFVGLAAWQLWRRESPKPHDEIIDTWAHTVLPECDGGNLRRACCLGLQAWRQLRPRWDATITTTAEADKVWAGATPMANFVPCLASRLAEAGAVEPGRRPVALAVIEDALEQFRGEDVEFAAELEKARGIVCALTG